LKALIEISILLNKDKMISNKLTPFIVEDGLNTSYIDALFVSLFFKPSHVQNILSDHLDDLNAMHLQDIIYHNFVHNMRHRYVIDSQIMNEIRNYFIYCGWKRDNEILNLFEVQELYNFLMEKFSQEKITFNKNNNEIIDINYIHLNVNNNSDIKTLLDEWITTTLGNFELKQIPKFIPIFLDRNISSTKINTFLIDIHEGIQFEKNNINEEQKNTMWKIHSIVCFSKTHTGHYYSIVQSNNSWFMYNNSKKPSLVNIDMKDYDIACKIQKECVFIMYTLDDK
jgi:hypothetical protein